MRVVHELRRLETQPYDDLPQVLFKEEIRFLYEDRERLKRTLEKQEERHKLALRQIKLKLAGLRDLTMKHRNHVVHSGKPNQHGFEEIINSINAITRVIKP